MPALRGHVKVLLTMNTLGIYVQVPFCQTKCTYCNFHTGVVSSARFAPYVNCVCGEMAGHRRLYEGAGITLPEAIADAVVDTIYMGGGTPSLLDASHLRRIVDAVRENFVAELTEVTLEADPETVTEEKAAAWVVAGINRVSFGVQSFCDEELKAAGRMHRRADVYRAAALLRGAGIANISFDLIAGLPKQSRTTWRESLDSLVELAPEHVSVYLLEVDEGSHLGAELLRGGNRYSAGDVPDDDAMAEFYETACAVLGAAGYEHYEISNWARPGFASRHNLKYWRREAYLGFGAGAHSFSGTERWANAHDAAGYVGALTAGPLPVEQVEKLTAESALEEELFLGLRHLDGIDIARIEREYGVSLDARFARLSSAGLIERDGSLVRLAPGRVSVSNEVFVELMK
ncbi:MAG: Oxygen-independent coproporphyrinogen-III oxidase-like protein [Candidatus Acidoferrum typicum]|nr:Oxygen-independent coproporphyrinogen-III oxidase-like protein [Candidatus Acidoferrum typicum]